MPAPYGGNDFVWIGCPYEWLGLLIMLVEEAVDCGLKVGDRPKHAAPASEPVAAPVSAPAAKADEPAARPAPEPAPAAEDPPRPRRSGWWQRARETLSGE